MLLKKRISKLAYSFLCFDMKDITFFSLRCTEILTVERKFLLAAIQGVSSLNTASTLWKAFIPWFCHFCQKGEINFRKFNYRELFYLAFLLFSLWSKVITTEVFQRSSTSEFPSSASSDYFWIMGREKTWWGINLLLPDPSEPFSCLCSWRSLSFQMEKMKQPARVLMNRAYASKRGARQEEGEGSCFGINYWDLEESKSAFSPTTL